MKTRKILMLLGAILALLFAGARWPTWMFLQKTATHGPRSSPLPRPLEHMRGKRRLSLSLNSLRGLLTRSGDCLQLSFSENRVVLEGSVPMRGGFVNVELHLENEDTGLSPTELRLGGVSAPPAYLAAFWARALDRLHPRSRKILQTVRRLDATAESVYVTIPRVSAW